MIPRQARANTSPVCPRCGYDYTGKGGPLAAANCDCDRDYDDAA